MKSEFEMMKKILFICMTFFFAGEASAQVEHPWAGKRVAFIGDSITDPNCYGSNIVKYWDFLKDWLNITPLVYGISGFEWWHAPMLADKLYQEHGTEVDAILVFLGTNDFNSGVPLGQWFREEEAETMRAKGGETKYLAKRIRRIPLMDESTFCGRINIAMEKLKTLWPEKQIILLTPLHRALADFGDTNYQPDESYQNEAGAYIDDYVSLVKQAGNVWGVPVIDLNSVSGLNPMLSSQLTYFYDEKIDQLHPSTQGHIRLAKTLVQQLLLYPVF